ncbi:hypothetical protein SAMN05444146_5236 [Flavobacterium johnsoniae]|nr:hypothetical protein SAMN05444146_5236 [Flavobacterium johnsoniae]
MNVIEFKNKLDINGRGHPHKKVNRRHKKRKYD